MRPRTGTITPLLAPAALAVLLAVVAAVLTRRHEEDARLLAEARVRLCLSLAAQSELRLTQLHRLFATATAGAGQNGLPDVARLDALLATLSERDAAFTGLALVDGQGRAVVHSGEAGARGLHAAFDWLRDAARSATGETVAGLYPAPDGGGRILLSRRLRPQGRGIHLRAEARAATLPAFALAPRPAHPVFVTTDGAVIRDAPHDALPVPAATLREMGAAAHDADGLVRRTVNLPDGGQVNVVAVPLPTLPLVLAFADPAPAEGPSSTALILLATGVLASLVPLAMRRAKNEGRA